MLSLYCHIPFCERKCAYCDFYSIESGTLMDEFVTALCGEVDRSIEAFGGRTARTVFFGGGTPSLLHPHQVERILASLHRGWSIPEDAEITLEVNPGTVDRERLAALRRLGINRLSIGIQSFNPRELQFLGRIHDARQARQCVEDARAAGFGNVSVDLIYSLPGQTKEEWLTSLDAAIRLSPDHISAYSLIVEEHTPLMRMVKAGTVVPNLPETEAELYSATMAELGRTGFDHYEVSNYARPGYRCRHNLTYWHHDEYLGFGPSAHSFLPTRDGRGGTRWSNIADVSAYIQSVSSGRSAESFRETVEGTSALRERIFLGLRSDGLDLDLLMRTYGYNVEENARSFLRDIIADGFATMLGPVLALTDIGYALCDEITLRLAP